MTYQQHIIDSKSITARFAVITFSDTRTVENDASGQKIVSLLITSSHLVTDYRIVKDDPKIIRPILDALLARQDIDAMLTSGGTGVSHRDQTIDIVQQLIEQPLPGFGELFRMLSYQQIGSGALLSRAMGGIARGKPLFAMPGSPAAAELAMTKLILPEIRHLLRELRKQTP